VHSKKGGKLKNKGLPASMIVEQKISLQVQSRHSLGNMRTKLTSTPSLTKRVDTLYILNSYWPPKFQQFDEKCT